MKLRTILGGLLLALSLHANAANLVTLPRQLVVDSDGEVRVGAKLYVYASGSTTPLTVYTTPALAATQANPVVSVSSGLFPAIYLAADVTSYKLVLKDSADVTLYTEDEIPAGLAGAFPRTDGEISAGVTPVDLDYPEGHSKRYGATCDGVADDTAEIQAAIDVAGEIGGTAHIQTGTCLVDTLTFDASSFILEGEGRGSILKASTDIPTTDIGGAVLVSLAGGADETVNQALLDGVYGADEILVRSNVAGSMENVVIRDLTFQGRNDGTSAIWATGFTRGSSIENVYVNGFEECGIRLNGSWSFGLDHIFIEGDGTGGTGLCFGVSGNGERSSSIAVNGVDGSNIEITGIEDGIVWNVGDGNSFTGLIIEGLDGDGVNGQSLDATSFVGWYCEDVALECFDLGGTNGTDVAIGLLIAGGHCNQDVGECVRLDGVQNSQIGPFQSVGANARLYVMTSSEGADTIGNLIYVPAVSGTYIQNSAELDLTDNIVFGTLATAERLNVPRLLVDSNVGFYGTTPVAQQADVGAVTDAGTGNDAIQDVTASHDQTILNNNFADVAEQLNELRAVLRAYGLMP
jgi:hypothetical protein